MKYKAKNIWKATASFLLVLFAMPLGHAFMIIMEKLLNPASLHYAGFTLGAVGLIMVIIGVFVKGDTKQTLWGLFGGLLFWTGWVEFIFMYYANRYGVQPEIVNGEVVTKPEYLIMPATFGFWVMFMIVYLFCIKTGCNFFNWIQKKIFRKRKDIIVMRPLTRHTAITTFMELNLMIWTFYLLLMFCYDKNFLGDHHPVTLIIGIGCLISSVFMFLKQLKINSWGANIRFSIATVIVFWAPVEIMGRINFFNEIWVNPMKYKTGMTLILAVFIMLAIYLWYITIKKKKENR